MFPRILDLQAFGLVEYWKARAQHHMDQEMAYEGEKEAAEARMQRMRIAHLYLIVSGILGGGLVLASLSFACEITVKKVRKLTNRWPRYIMPFFRIRLGI